MDTGPTVCITKVLIRVSDLVQIKTILVGDI